MRELVINGSIAHPKNFGLGLRLFAGAGETIWVAISAAKTPYQA